MRVTAGIFLASILLKEMRYLVCIRYLWSSSSDQIIVFFIVLKIPLFSMLSIHVPVIRMFHCLFIVLKFSLFPVPSSHYPVIRMFHCFSLFWKSHCSPCHPVIIQWSECSLSFHCFEILIVPHSVQSLSSDQNVFHCFENPTVLHAIQSLSSDQNVHCLFIVLKFSLFPIPSSRYPVIRMFHCFSLFWKCHCSQFHPVTHWFEYLWHSGKTSWSSRLDRKLKFQ
jgi:hypothetical protein